MIQQLTRAIRQRVAHKIDRFRLKQFLATVDNLPSIRARHPEFAKLRAKICRAGTDHLKQFANGYTHEGGLYLQQNPDEFAALCLFLKERAPHKNYLEIGSASGGVCLFLSREVGFGRVVSVDDGNHPRAPEQPKNFAEVPNFKQFIGDSHSEAAARFLREELDEKLDVAFIDGDHSYEGAWQDVLLTHPHCRPGALMIFHDTVACPEVRTVWMKCIDEKRVQPLAEFVGEDRPLGIAIGAVL